MNSLSIKTFKFDLIKVNLNLKSKKMFISRTQINLYLEIYNNTEIEFEFVLISVFQYWCLVGVATNPKMKFLHTTQLRIAFSLALSSLIL
jgi:hypothetical protein